MWGGDYACMQAAGMATRNRSWRAWGATLCAGAANIQRFDLPAQRLAWCALHRCSTMDAIVSAMGHGWKRWTDGRGEIGSPTRATDNPTTTRAHVPIIPKARYAPQMLTDVKFSRLHNIPQQPASISCNTNQKFTAS